MISRAAMDAGLEVDFIFIVDDADPLRRVYPFLDDEYSKYIGHQIGNIPALMRTVNRIISDLPMKD